MRARNKIYHTECFRCVACERQLIPGDEFALREEGLFCKADSEVSSDGFGTTGCFTTSLNNNSINLNTDPSISTSNNSPSSNHSGGQSSGAFQTTHSSWIAWVACLLSWHESQQLALGYSSCLSTNEAEEDDFHCSKNFKERLVCLVSSPPFCLTIGFSLI